MVVRQVHRVGLRVLEAVADARLGSEVDDAVELVSFGECLQRIGIGEIHALETETS